MSRSPLVLAVAAVAAAAGAGCGSGGEPGRTVPAAVSKPRLTSSIAEGAQLDKPIRWEARLAGVDPSDVTEVRFLIDGRVRHVEREAPYEFAGRGNRLLPGTLGHGSHTFAVDAQVAGGPRLTTASTATVSRQADGVPPEVVGRWTRTVTAAEVRRTESFRKAESGEPLPVGTWRLRIGADGVAQYLLASEPNDVTVGQVRFEPGGRLVVGNEIPNFPQASEGGFCPDTVGTGEYRWSLSGGALVVHVVNDHQCADRNSFWNGRFTR